MDAIGFVLMCITIIWGIVFLFEYDLTIKEKIKLVFYCSIFVICLVASAVLLSGGK